MMAFLVRLRIAHLHRVAVRRRQRCYHAEAKYHALVKRLPPGADLELEVSTCPALTILSRLDPDSVLPPR